MAEWSEVALDDHDPFILDAMSGGATSGRQHMEAVESMAFVQGLNEYGTAADVDGSVVLHVVAANDRVVPKTQSDAVKWQWGAQQVVIEGQGHELGDQGWEVSVMGPVEKFLNSL